MKLNREDKAAAEMIADVMASPDAVTATGDKLNAHFHQTMLRADFSNPETIRRLYPIACALIEEFGGIELETALELMPSADAMRAHAEL